MNAKDIKSHIWITYQGAEGVMARIKNPYALYGAATKLHIERQKIVIANTFPILNTTEIGKEIHGEDLELVWQFKNQDGEWITKQNKLFPDNKEYRKALRYIPKQTPKADSEKKGEPIKNELVEIAQKELPLLDLIDSNLFEIMQRVYKQHLYITSPLKKLAQYGIHSQNVMKLLDYPGIASEQRVALHKLIFACEGLRDDTNFKELEKFRIAMVCAKYRKEPTPLSKVDNHIGETVEDAANTYFNALKQSWGAKHGFIAGANWRTQHPDPEMVAELKKYKTLYEELGAIIEPLQEKIILLEAEKGAMVDRILNYVADNAPQKWVCGQLICSATKYDIKSMRGDILKLDYGSFNR